MTSSSNDRIGELLDRAIDSVNSGDLATAYELAGQVLLEDSGNRDASELLAADGLSNGELRRLTILCCDLVGSTELSERQAPEQYRTLIRRYQRLVRSVVEALHGGHIVSVKGDGFLALFGYPTAREDDTARAVQAGLDLCRAVRRLSQQAQRELAEVLDVRVGVHRGLVFIDTEEDDVYGLTANLASRVEGIAAPGTVVITEDVRQRVADKFELTAGPPQLVKGVTEPVRPFTVLGERVGGGEHPCSSPLVGRHSELEVLRSAWSATGQSPSTSSDSVLIKGEPGIGKSRLAAELADEVRRSSRVVELSGSQFHVGVGFHPIGALLERRCGIGRDDDAAERLRRLRAELEANGGEALVPLLAPILGLTPNAGYRPMAVEGRKLAEDILAAVFDYLVGCFRGAGLLLVEDVQWLDESTLALLAEMLQRGPNDVLVVMTSRTSIALHPRTTIELGPLTRDECLSLLETLDPGDLHDCERGVIVDRSDGVPLYLEELARGGPGVGSDADAGDGVADVAGDPVPDAIYEPLVARLLAVDDGASVAGAAATIGREVDRSVLGALVDDVDPDSIDEVLTALTAANVLVADGSGGRGYRFRHELVRRVAYDLQTPATRRRIHGRVADLLVLGAESEDVVDWNLAATNYERGARPGEAADAHAHAADRARRRGALAEARAGLGRSIDLISRLPDGRRRSAREVGLRLRRGFLAMSTEGAGSAAAAGDYARCLELAMTDPRGDEMFSSLISLWAYHLSRAELDRSREVLETLRKVLDGPRSAFAPSNRAGFGIISWFEGEFVDASEHLEAAAVDADPLGRDAIIDEAWFVPNDPTVSIHTHLALARFMRGDFHGADEEMARSVALAGTLDFPQGPWSTAYAAWLRSWMSAERNDFDGALADAAMLLDLSVAHGFDSWGLIAMTQQTAVQATRAIESRCSQEEAAQHAAVLGGMVGMWQAVELHVFLPYYLTILGATLAAAGDAIAAAGRYDEARELADRTGMRFYATETARRRAQLSTDAGSAVSELRAALDAARATGARPFELRIALDLCALDPDGAAPVLASALRGFPHDASSIQIAAARARTAAVG